MTRFNPVSEEDFEDHMDRIYSCEKDVFEGILRHMPFGKTFHLSDGRLVVLKPFGDGVRAMNAEDSQLTIGMDALIYPAGKDPDDPTCCPSHIEFHLIKTGGGGMTFDAIIESSNK